MVILIATLDWGLSFYLCLYTSPLQIWPDRVLKTEPRYRDLPPPDPGPVPAVVCNELLADYFIIG